MAWRNFAERNPDLPVGFVIKSATATDVPEEVVSAYEAPWPNAESKAGVAMFPLLVPTTPDAPGRGGDARRPGAARRVGEAGARVLLRLRPDLHPQGRPAVRRPDPRRRRAARDRGRRRTSSRKTGAR